ncbi:hypothetical protein N7533_008553 [Penicillium manginii]|uniref:uncharacterized protein n=1 Tax=Penicillium manginii TaxID=203109 RepID=UPI00254727CF|nr:uncharacterized protein N7533_008553 [Penicillium manginii]KAJ5743683.1 hypothetical protein N7533_008553 [Penicillium manginii]
MAQPQWQIDIPGLSQLVLNVGAYGLKQLALAGVDPHTIGCMLMIAEYTPACPDFRSKLNKTREYQRTERIWLYKMIEIGTSINFLADQMLKTRAGENVVALLSAVAPFMDEKSCVTVLLSLFEAAKVSLDNTPGLTQLQNIRRSLVPLACKAGMGEKVINYHYFFSSLLKKQHKQHAPPTDSIVPYDAIPTSHDIPRIVQLIHKLSTSGARQVIIFKGIRGAAWIAAYTSYILGLPTCALDADERSVPITSNYDAAQIIFDVSSTEQNGGLYLEGEVLDLISLDRRAIDNSSGWRVDCSIVDFFNIHHPDLRMSRPDTFTRLSTFAAIDLLNTLADLSASFDHPYTDSTRYRSRFGRSVGLQSYTISVLQKIQARGFRILKILGFRPPDEGYHFQKSQVAARLHCTGHDSDPKPTEEEYLEGEEDDSEQSYGEDSDHDSGFLGGGFKSFARRFRKKRDRGRRTFKSRRGQYIEYGGIQFESDAETKRLRYYLDDPTSDTLQEDLRGSSLNLAELTQTIQTAVHFASRLAFTDWDQSLRTMSVRAFSYKEIPERSMVTKFEGHIAEAISLCCDGTPIKNIEQHLWSEDWIGLDIDGIIIIRNAALPVCPTNMNGAFLGFRRGGISYESQQFSKIRTDQIDTLGHNLVLKSGHKLTRPTLGPRNAYPKIHSRCLLATRSDTIFVRLEVFPSPGICLVGNGSLAASFLPDFLVTTPCEHGYYSEEILTGTSAHLVKDLYEGLLVDDVESRSESFFDEQICISYQQVSGNTLGQWLALQWQPAEKPEQCLRIIQRDCCITCVLSRLQRVSNKAGGFLTGEFLTNGYPICIMAGQPEDQ